MNQILVTEKLYITPDMKKKRKGYKVLFGLCAFFICVLFSYYIYAEYDKNKSEQVSKQLLANMQEDTTISKEKNSVIVVALGDNRGLTDEEEIIQEKTVDEILKERKSEKIVWRTASNGEQYYVLGTIKIPKIDVDYPILSDCTETLLKISPGRFWGPDPNEVGNLCIAGHNYLNSKFFSKVPTLENGDIIEITDLLDNTVKYEVYDKYMVDNENTDCTYQETRGKREVTLITCNNDSSKRVIVKCREVK